MSEERELIEIPFDALDTDVLTSVIESFVLREGTNYGVEEVTLERKVEQVRKQLESKKVKLVFDTETESCHILTDQALREGTRPVT